MGIKSDLVAKRDELDALNKKLQKNNKDTYDGKDYDLMKSTVLKGDDSRQRLDNLRGLKAKQDELGKEVDDLAAAVKAMESSAELDEEREQHARKGLVHPVDREQKGQKNFADQFIESKAYKDFKDGKTDLSDLKASFDVELKTVMTTSAGFAPESTRTGEIVPYAQEQPLVFDAMPKAQTSIAAIVYMEQTIRTNAAAAKTESTGAYAESAIAYTEQSVTVRDIGTVLPVTNEQIEDVLQLRDILNTELPQMLRQTLSNQALNGTGVAPNVLGILNKSGILTQAKSGDTTDTLYKASTQIRVTGKANANLIIMHPNDWQPVRLMRTNDGLYIWGNPSETGPMRMWGKTVLQSTDIAEKTSVIGDFATYAKYFEKLGITIEITDSHSTDFIYGKQMMRARTRGAFRWTRPQAFAKVTL